MYHRHEGISGYRMKTGYFSETSVYLYQIVRRHIPLKAVILTVIAMNTEMLTKEHLTLIVLMWRIG